MEVKSIQFTSESARLLDNSDPLKHFRDQYYIPKGSNGYKIYLCGNSLGLQPRATAQYLEEELELWQKMAVDGHFHGERPWFHYHKFFNEPASRIVGAQPDEVVVMNSLTVNLHLMMVSFYRPDKKRYKIMMEAGAFPSDQYAMESQVKFHGYNPEEAIIELKPREGEHTLRTEDILEAIDDNANELALIMFGGVNYYTGQFFNLEAITQKGHEHDITVGFDLAHTAGNIPLKLHDWGVDFAVWCSYKYLNSGPGGPSGVFVHENHGKSPQLPRFAGWWGHDESERFKMQKGFKPMYGAAGWQLSNAQVFSMAPHLAALKLFDEAGMDNLIEKSGKLTAFMEHGINELNKKFDNYYTILTPEDIQQRGAQLSIVVKENGRELFERIIANDVVADWREPDVIRVAPVPMYHSFEDVYAFVELLGKHAERDL